MRDLLQNIILTKGENNMLPDTYTFKLVDGYTGEVLHEIGDRVQIYPESARIVMCLDYDMIFIHQTTLKCCCKRCMNTRQYVEYMSK